MLGLGFQKAESELGVEIKVLEPQSVADYLTSITSLARVGFDLVIAVGADQSDALTSAKEQFPDVKFAGINIALEGDNTTVVKFSDHEGSFLAGAIAALFTSTGKIGFIGGADVPAINRFYVGYEEGAKYTNPDVEIVSSYVGSFADPGKGKEFALQLISQEVDIIFQVGGKTGEGVFEAVKDNENVFAIGVDQDQDYIVEGKILTSMIKRVDVAVYDIIKTVVDGNFTSGDKIYGLSEDGVGLSEMIYTKDLIPEDVLNTLVSLKQNIIEENEYFLV